MNAPCNTQSQAISQGSLSEQFQRSSLEIKLCVGLRVLLTRERIRIEANCGLKSVCKMHHF